ncbi:MAG: P-II family nitrogen regulator [Candidatus Krumholzibacteriia bacterium]
MKEIKAVVPQFMGDKVIDSLREVAHLPGIIVSLVNGFSRSDPSAEPAERVEDAPMIKIEIVVPNEIAETVVETISHAAHTGRPGDGKIFVYEVVEVIEISTGERGDAAI